MWLSAAAIKNPPMKETVISPAQADVQEADIWLGSDGLSWPPGVGWGCGGDRKPATGVHMHPSAWAGLSTRVAGDLSPSSASSRSPDAVKTAGRAEPGVRNRLLETETKNVGPSERRIQGAKEARRRRSTRM